MGKSLIFANFADINPYIALGKNIEYPFVEMADIIPGRRYVKAAANRQYTGGGSRFSAGDVLFARITPCLENGKIAQFKSMGDVAFGSTEFIVFRNIQGISDQSFMYYLANSDLIRKPAEKSMSGASGRQRADLSTIKNIEIPEINLPAQRKIAVILSAYDDLIENNQRRIKIMEEIAQNIYREWFVKFRFPGCEKAKMIDSSLGTIPEGWEIKNLGQVSINFDRLRKPLSGINRNQRRGIYPYYGAAKIIDYIDNYIFNGEYLLIAEDGSVITADNKPVLQLVDGKFWPNNHTHVIQGKVPISTKYLNLVLSNYDISGHITGAAQPKITQENLNRIKIIVPQAPILEKFDSFIGNIFSETMILENKNIILRRTRDLLLPKLISGEIDVSDLDIRVEEAT